MKTLDDPAIENQFPEALRRLTINRFETAALGMTLLDQQALGDGADSGLHGRAAAILHGREMAQAESYRLSKRRAEFLAGRVSAKLALAQFWAAKGFCRALSSVQIVNDPTGRPFIRMEPVPGDKIRQPPEISISHGGGYGAALAADVPCGIDLQEQRHTLLKVMGKYCMVEEDHILAAALPKMAPPARLSLLWTAKEAAKKACSSRWMPGFLDLLLEGFECQEGDCLVLELRLARRPEDCRLPAALTVLATTFHNHGLAVCIINEARRNAGTAGS